MVESTRYNPRNLLPATSDSCMTDALRSDRPGDAPDRERDARIEELLLSGLDHYFAGQHELAINVWTRVLFLDRGHAQARAYIERARSALAERQREGDELLHTGAAALTAATALTARQLLTSAVERGASGEEALALLHRLDRLEAAVSRDRRGPRLRRRPRRRRRAAVRRRRPARVARLAWVAAGVVAGDPACGARGHLSLARRGSVRADRRAGRRRAGGRRRSAAGARRACEIRLPARARSRTQKAGCTTRSRAARRRRPRRPAPRERGRTPRRRFNGSCSPPAADQPAARDAGHRPDLRRRPQNEVSRSVSTSVSTAANAAETVATSSRSPPTRTPTISRRHASAATSRGPAACATSR